MSEQTYTEYITKVVYPNITKVSAFGALFVILIMVGLTIYDRKLVDRVSLRLQTGIAAYDLWFHTGPLWMRSFDSGPGPMCNFIAWQVIFFPLVYSFLNVSIGVNLQLIFLHDVTITKWIEVLYWTIPIVSAFLISVIPLALGKLGYSEYNGCFTSGNDINDGKIIDAFALEMWIVLSIIYLVIIVCLVIIKLRNGIRGLKVMNNFEENIRIDKQERIIKKMIYRILLYPFVMIATQLGSVTYQLYYDTHPSNMETLDQWGYITASLTGLLNFIAFCCDPTLHSALYTIYKNKFKSNIDSTKENEFHLSPTGLNQMKRIEDGTLDEQPSNEEYNLTTYKVVRKF